MFDFDIRETNGAVRELLEVTDNPRHRQLLLSYDRHRNLEMAGRWEEIFAPEMTADHPIYRFDMLGQTLVLNGRDEVQSVYREWTETDQNIFYVENEQLAVGDHLIVSRSTMYQQTPGTALTAAGVEADEGAWYLTKSCEAMIWPYDDRCRLVGEDVWEFDPSGREFIKLDPADVLTTEQAAVLLDPLIKPLPAFEESMSVAS